MRILRVEINLAVYLPALISTLLAFSTGLCFTWPSSVLPKLIGSSDNPLGRTITVFEQSWISGFTIFGAIFGPLITLFIDRHGRKKVLLYLSVPFIVSLLMVAFSKTILLFFIARFIMGLSAGGTFTSLPIYLAEIAETHNRGILTCMMSVLISIGIVFTYSVGPFVSIQNYSLLSLIPLVIFIPLCLFFLPESPQFFAYINDHPNLKKSLVKLRHNKTPQAIEAEMIEIIKTVEELRRNQGGIKDLFKLKVLRRALFITLGLVAMQQCAGSNAVLTYMQLIFDEANTNLSSELSAIIVGIVQVIVLALTSSFVDIVGRKILFLISAVGSSLSLIVLGAYFFLKNQEFDVGSLSWLPVSSLIVFIIVFNIGMAPLPWTVMAEMFPLDVKATASLLAASTSMAIGFVILFCFPLLSTYVGMDVTFGIFASVCLIDAVGIWWFLPETKGRTLQEIQELLGGGKLNM